MDAGSEKPASTKVPPKNKKMAPSRPQKASSKAATSKHGNEISEGMAKALELARALLDDDEDDDDDDDKDNNDAEVIEAPEEPGNVASNPTAKLPSNLRKRKVVQDLEKDVSEDSGQMDLDDDDQTVPTNEPLNKRRRERKSKKATDTVPIDAEEEEQRDARDLELPSKFAIVRSTLTEEAAKSASMEKSLKRSDNTIIIARRRRLKKSNLEVLVWDDGELEWMRKTYATKLYKKTVERYDEVEKDDWRDVAVDGWDQVRVLNKVVLIDNPVTHLPTAKTEVTRRFKGNDGIASSVILQYILKKVSEPSSWLPTPMAGSYQYATAEDEATARSWKPKSAQNFVDVILKRKIKGSKSYEKADEILNGVDVVWRYSSDKIRFVGANENPPSPSTGMTRRIKLMDIWAIFLERFHIWQNGNDDGGPLSTTVDVILSQTKAERKELGRRMITDSPHIARLDSWPYLLALVLLTKDEAEGAESEASLTPSDARFRDAVHTCMTQYQEETGTDYPQAVHMFYLLQQLLQADNVREKIDKEALDNPLANRSDVDSGQRSDSGHDEGADTVGSGDDAAATEQPLAKKSISKKTGVR